MLVEGRAASILDPSCLRKNDGRWQCCHTGMRKPPGMALPFARVPEHHFSRSYPFDRGVRGWGGVVVPRFSNNNNPPRRRALPFPEEPSTVGEGYYLYFLRF